jgi:MFS family permease
LDSRADPFIRHRRHADDGEASDRWGRRGVLVTTALSGATLSLTFGWLIDIPLIPLLVITFLYGFAVLGDSGVLSTAMTEAIHPQYLEHCSPFDRYSDSAREPYRHLSSAESSTPRTRRTGCLIYGLGFMALGVGGAIASVCALMLPGKNLRGRLALIA